MNINLELKHYIFILCTLLMATLPVRAELISDDVWKIESGDTVDSILDKLFVDKPYLKARIKNIIYKINPSSFDAESKALLTGKTLRIPGAKMPQVASAPVPVVKTPVPTVKAPVPAVKKIAPKVVKNPPPKKQVQGKSPVGHIVLTAGQVEAVNEKGVSRPLKRKSEIFEGDNLKTASDAQTQIRFTDGALLALRPNSEFKVVRYQYKKTAEDTEEQGIFNLLKGGFRTITGFIGKKNKDNYRIDTPIATIGIRGTHYGVRLCEQQACAGSGSYDAGLYGGVVDGSIAVANNAGEKIFNNDQYFHVANNSDLARGLIIPPGIIFDGSELKRDAQRPQDVKEKIAQRREQARQQNQQVNDQARDPAQQIQQQVSADVQRIAGAIVSGNAMRNVVASTLAANQIDIHNPNFESGEVTVTLSDGSTGSYQLPPIPIPGDLAPFGTRLNFSFIGVDADAAGTNNVSFSANTPTVRSDGTLNQLILLDDVGVFSNIPIALRANDDLKDRRFFSNEAALRNVGVDTEVGALWGRWQGDYSLKENDTPISKTGDMHFIYSPNVTPLAALQQLGQLGSYVTFNLIDGTNPTDHQGNVGTLINASLTVDFVGSAVTDFFISTQHGQDTYYGQYSPVDPTNPIVPFSALYGSDNNTIHLAGTCSGTTLCANPIPIKGDASVTFVNAGSTPAVGAISSYSLTTYHADPANPVFTNVGTTGAVLLKRDIGLPLP